MDQPIEPMAGRLRRLLGTFADERGLSLTAEEEQPQAGCGWVRLESADVIIDAVRDRGQEWITITAKDRPRPRAPRRSWPMGHLVAYLDGEAGPHPVSNFETEAGWLTRRAAEVLDPSMLNSEGLRRWSVRADQRRSRRPGD